MLFSEILKAVLYGIVEGVTEWLPISSTGHLILLERLISFGFSGDPVFLSEFREMFDVVIQLGAVFAVVVLYRQRLFPFWRSQESRRDTWKRFWTLWGKIALSCIPAALVGILGDRILKKTIGKDLDALLFHAPVVAVALIVYGVAFLFSDRRKSASGSSFERAENVSCQKALGIGCFQALSIIPGTSRSGSTMLGGTLLGVGRYPAAEFSFWMAIPTMAGASLVKAIGFFSYLRESGAAVPSLTWWILSVGCLVSFSVSLAAIRFLTDFVKKHGFCGFGIYRILLGILVLILLR